MRITAYQIAYRQGEWPVPSSSSRPEMRSANQDAKGYQPALQQPTNWFLKHPVGHITSAEMGYRSKLIPVLVMGKCFIGVRFHVSRRQNVTLSSSSPCPLATLVLTISTSLNQLNHHSLISNFSEYDELDTRRPSDAHVCFELLLKILASVRS
jgi:hypothetical protein